MVLEDLNVITSDKAAGESWGCVHERVYILVRQGIWLWYIVRDTYICTGCTQLTDVLVQGK